MAHAYSPGLRVTDRAVLRRERRLPLKGQVLVQANDPVRGRAIGALLRRRPSRSPHRLTIQQLL